MTKHGKKYLAASAKVDANTLYEPQKAMELVKKEKPVLLISDILQPGIDGVGLCQSIKEDPQLEDIKVILMSGVYKQASFRREMMGTPPDGFIEKPLDVQQLENLVEKTLKVNKLEW